MENLFFDHQILFVGITLFFALLGGLLFLKLRIPTGAFLGAMVFAMVLSIFLDAYRMPSYMSTTAKIAAGTFIGTKISRHNIANLRKIILPIIINTVVTLCISLAVGLFIYTISPLNKVTALFGTAPGRIADMALISLEYGADMTGVALLQTVRLLTCIIGFPFIVNRLRIRNSTATSIKTFIHSSSLSNSPLIRKRKNPSDLPKHESVQFLLIIAAGGIGGILGHIASIPAGALIGPIVLVAFVNLLWFNIEAPKKIGTGIQILIGAVIGSSIKMSDLVHLKELLLPAIVVSISMVLLGVSLGFLYHKIWHIELGAALISATPGGLTQLSTIVQDLDVDVSVMASFHLSRLLSVLIVYPFLMELIIR